MCGVGGCVGGVLLIIIMIDARLLTFCTEGSVSPIPMTTNTNHAQLPHHQMI